MDSVHAHPSSYKITISGNWVSSSTFLTGTPIFSIADAVPPVEMIEYLKQYDKLLHGGENH